MRFTQQQIDLACTLKDQGLPWRPGPGQYAYDREQRIGPGSPFQDRVYFFLDFPCFVDYFGSIAKLREAMVWLPTWEQASLLLRQEGLEHFSFVSGETFSDRVELDGCYRALLKTLDR